MSARMMAILGDIAPGQEIYSIDESFLDVSSIAAYVPLEEYGHQVRAMLPMHRHGYVCQN